MPDWRTVESYSYDGSFDGLLTCIFECFLWKERPSRILSLGEEQLTLTPPRFVETDPAKAARVAASIPKKISPEALRWVQDGFLSCAENRELLILDFLRIGYRQGFQTTRMLQDGTVSALQKAVQFVENEAHLLKEFLRFSERGGILTAVIDPKNRVLPLIAPHFMDRLPQETFFIYDQTHGMLLVHQKGEFQILPADGLDFLEDEPEEREYQELWKRFYDTIAVEGRYNPKCRMTHCPKRYWKNMTELAAEVGVRPARLPKPEQDKAALKA